MKSLCSRQQLRFEINAIDEIIATDRRREWESLFERLNDVRPDEAVSFDLADLHTSSSFLQLTFSEELFFSGEEDPKCLYYKINDDPATAKPLQFNYTLERCYKMNHCYLLREFKEMMLSVSSKDNGTIQTLVASYVEKAHVQTAIDHLEYYCSKLYFILFYDIWLKKTHGNEAIHLHHKKFTTNLLGELKDEVKNGKHFVDYFKYVHFAYTVTERIVKKAKKQQRKWKRQ